MAGDGRYSFKGSGYVRGGIFDRFQIVQGDTSIRFHDNYHKRLRHLAGAEGAPELKDVDLFRTPADLKFDAASPWKLELLVGRNIGPTKKAFLTFDLEYNPPEKYLNFTEIEVPPTKSAPRCHQSACKGRANLEKMWAIQTCGTRGAWLALAVLTLRSFFSRTGWSKDPKIRRSSSHRLSYLYPVRHRLVFQRTVVGGQYPAMFNALVSGFDWGYFLMEPLIFILWGSVAAGVVVLGAWTLLWMVMPFWCTAGTDQSDRQTS